MNACPTVLTDILVLIIVGHGLFRAVSAIVIVVDCLCSAYPCAASMNACPTVLADILVLIIVGHGFIRAVSGVVIVVDFLCFAYPCGGKHECLPYGPHGHPCVG